MDTLGIVSMVTTIVVNLLLMTHWILHQCGYEHRLEAWFHGAKVFQCELCRDKRHVAACTLS